PAGVVEIRELLKALVREKGVTIFMSSHILTEVARLATRIGIIHMGRLVEELDSDKLEKIRAKRVEVKARNLDGALTALQKAGYPGLVKDESIMVEDPRAIESPEEIARILVNAGVPPTRLSVEQEDLEEHFLRLTGGGR
ncbi:MAG: ABC transporter ATP-binding protein, partial [Spirochaetia bacterium]|nr:ABC transporter ATP-binding protein [Spirochaetia bacterium]